MTDRADGMDVVRAALKELKDAGADQAVASLTRGEKSELNVDSGRMSLYRTTANVSIGVMALVGSRKGSVSVNDASPEAIRKAAKEAVATARAGRPDPANGISPGRELERFSRGPDKPDSDAMYARLREFVDYAGREYPDTKLEQCVLDFVASESFYANSNGAEFAESYGAYDFSAMFTTKRGGRASSFNSSGASHLSLDTPLAQWGGLDRLMRESAASLDARPVDRAFKGDLILTPDCLGDFLSFLDGAYMGDYALITGNSPWKKKLGRRVLSPLVTVRSEPNGPRVELGYGYTGDGFRAENCAIIEAGRLESFTLGLYGSNKTGLPRCPSGGGAVIMEPGGTPYNDMLASVKRGIVMSRFSGGSPSDNGDFSGVAKNSFLVENGRIIRPLAETMVAGNLARLFNDVRAVSKETVSFGSSILPWVLCGGVHISGAVKGRGA